MTYHNHECPSCGGQFQCSAPHLWATELECLGCETGRRESRSSLNCADCHAEKPFVKWLNDDGVWVWLGLECAARRGNPTAVHIKTMHWIDSQLTPAISVEGVM